MTDPTPEPHPPQTRALRGPTCSVGARRRADPLTGTAPPARRWLLVEHEGGWLPEAFAGLGLDAAVKSEVLRAAEQTQARILLIRRPGRAAATAVAARGAARSWCVVDPASSETIRWGTWHSAEELHGAVDVLRVRHREAGARTGAASGMTRLLPPAAEPELLLVCTHGRKDVCCAVRGRPVAAVVAARWPAATWECSHTGGDRFAANLVVLPGGVVYGGLDPERAVEVVMAHHRGSPVLAHLRGVAGHSPAVQAAIAAVHDQRGPLPWGRVHPLAVRSRDRSHSVTLAVAESTVEVTVTEEVRPPHLLTCQAPAPGPATVPVAGRVRTISR